MAAGLPRRAAGVAMHHPHVVVEGDLLGDRGGPSGDGEGNADLDELAHRVLHDDRLAELKMMFNEKLAAAMLSCSFRQEHDVVGWDGQRAATFIIRTI